MPISKSLKKEPLSIQPVKPGAYQANLESFGAEIKDLLDKHKPTPTAIDPQVVVAGLRDPKYLVIAGFSTRKIYDDCMKQDKTIDYVLFIEPNVGNFHATLEREYVGDIFEDERVSILLGIPAEEMIPHLYQIFTASDPKSGSRATKIQSPEIVADPFIYKPVDDKMPDDAIAIITKVREASKQAFLAMGCASDSFNRTEQLLRNEDALKNSVNIKSLFNKFGDVPAIVLGAGPSCKEFIDVYKSHNLSDKFLLICCDAALPLLLESEIHPHIVTRCERKYTQIFSGAEQKPLDGILYAAYPWCSPEYFSMFPDRAMLFRANGLCKWTGLDPGFVDGGVSSANAAAELAALMGCKVIMFAGVDLCFLDDKSHVAGTEVEFDIQKSKSKWSKIPGNSGEVTTIPVWFRCKNEYEATVIKHKDVAWINTSVKGAKINGMRVAPLIDLLPAMKEKKFIRRKIRELSEYSSDDDFEKFTAKKAITLKFFKQVKKDLQKLFLNLADNKQIARRETDKIAMQSKTFSDSSEYFIQARAATDSLENIYKEPARQIDEFKKKYYSLDLFSLTLLDICQVDYFINENKTAALENTVTIKFVRYKHYVDLTVSFFKTLEYYTDELIRILEDGPGKREEL